MGTHRDAVFSRRFAPQWQIVLLHGLSQTDSVRAIYARFCSFFAISQVFSLFGSEARPSDTAVYASLIHRRAGREARLIRRIAYTTLASA